jgi:very-short-patch-repair endonuclease
MGRGSTRRVVEGSMALRDRVASRNAAVLRARRLRREPSLPEGFLWRILRTRPGGFKFRFQHPLERCTVDFYCPAARLVIEVDGDSHSMGTNPTLDAARDAWLERKGLQVLRFDAADVLRDIESVVRAILRGARR